MAGPAPARDAEAARGIDAAHDRMRQALHDGDVLALAENYTADCRLYSPLKPVCDSRAELVKQMQYAIDIGLYDFELVREELLGRGDHVVELGLVTFFDQAGAKLSQIRYMTVWKKVDGRWRIWRDMAA